MLWTVFVSAVLLNTLLCVAQYLVEQNDKNKGRIAPRHSRIPGTNQIILYWEDYHTQIVGDFFGLLWIMNGFIHLLVRGQITTAQWEIFGVVSFCAALIFLLINLRPGHRPDWGWPAEKKISWGGFSHLPYFGINAGMSAICLIHMINGDIRGWLLLTTIGGGAIWIASAIADLKAGHFDGLKKI